MIILLTIVISIFIIINSFSIIYIFTYDDYIEETKLNEKILKISKCFLISEGLLLVVILILLISYPISRAIVCTSTHGDYKGCTELKESDNNE